MSSHDSKRNDVLKSAEVLFAKRGFSGTSTREICKLANVNIGAISYHFGGKEGLYLEIFKQCSYRLFSAMYELFDKYQAETLTPEQADSFLSEYIALLVDLRTNEPGVQMFIQKENLVEVPGLKDFVANEVRQFVDKQSAFFMKLERQGYVSHTKDWNSVVILIAEAVWGYMSLSESDTNLFKSAYRFPEDKKSFVDLIKQLFFCKLAVQISPKKNSEHVNTI